MSVDSLKPSNNVCILDFRFYQDEEITKECKIAKAQYVKEL